MPHATGPPEHLTGQRTVDVQPVEKQIRSSLVQTLEIRRDGNAAHTVIEVVAADAAAVPINCVSRSLENSPKFGSMKECHHMVL